MSAATEHGRFLNTLDEVIDDERGRATRLVVNVFDHVPAVAEGRPLIAVDVDGCLSRADAARVADALNRAVAFLDEDVAVAR